MVLRISFSYQETSENVQHTPSRGLGLWVGVVCRWLRSMAMSAVVVTDGNAVAKVGSEEPGIAG